MLLFLLHYCQLSHALWLELLTHSIMKAQILTIYANIYRIAVMRVSKRSIASQKNWTENVKSSLIYLAPVAGLKFDLFKGHL
jgi:hypothetical protein